MADGQVVPLDSPAAEQWLRDIDAKVARHGWGDGGSSDADTYWIEVSDAMSDVGWVTVPAPLNPIGGLPVGRGAVGVVEDSSSDGTSCFATESVRSAAAGAPPLWERLHAEAQVLRRRREVWSELEQTRRRRTEDLHCSHTPVTGPIPDGMAPPLPCPEAPSLPGTTPRPRDPAHRAGLPQPSASRYPPT
eukprot:TRINITY_DN19830_c0_g1_i2.p2 TRINITY_DN19830_c0_g1~~TRINITY_DN19830_c0_g1_i2.p2  ORF type:complete len:208 (+),score=49.72 TRINITY_DN19830_c0_g1_i2:55-624(+)